MSTRKKLFLWIAAILGSLLFITVFILGLPWRWAVERRVAEIKARGEPVCLADLEPKAVSPTENGGLLLENLWASLKNEPIWNSAGFNYPEMDGVNLIYAIKFCRGVGVEPEFYKKMDLNKKVELEKSLKCLEKIFDERPELMGDFKLCLSKNRFKFRTMYKYHDSSLPSRTYSPQTSLIYLRRTILFFESGYYYFKSKDMSHEAGDCLRIILNIPKTLDDCPGLRSDIDARTSLTETSIEVINRLIPCMNNDDLIIAKEFATNNREFPISNKDIYRRERIRTIEDISEGFDYYEAMLRWSDALGDDDTFSGVFKSKLYIYTGWKYRDLLWRLDDYEIKISNEKTITKPSYLELMFNSTYHSVDHTFFQLKLEAARIRQLRLGLALELIKRKTGRYPADLSGIELPKEDTDGKPMKYEVFDEGRGACLKFDNKTNSKTVHFGLGELPEKHPLGEAAK